MANDLLRRIDVFFYGLFMDESLLQTKGIKAQHRRLAKLDNFRLVIGERATLVPSPGETVHGVIFSLTHAEIDSLYAERSVSVYRPEAVITKVAREESVPALCFNLPTAPATSERNPQYVAQLRELAERIGLPAEYIATIA